MYLLVDEAGSVQQAEELDQELKDCIAEGYLRAVKVAADGSFLLEDENGVTTTVITH